jgi:hypothetical protein
MPVGNHCRPLTARRATGLVLLVAGSLLVQLL